MEYTTDGKKIKPLFLFPCPNRCSLTGGCIGCRLWDKQEIKSPNSIKEPEEMSSEQWEEYYESIGLN